MRRLAAWKHTVPWRGNRQGSNTGKGISGPPPLPRLFPISEKDKNHSFSIFFVLPAVQAKLAATCHSDHTAPTWRPKPAAGTTGESEKEKNHGGGSSHPTLLGATKRNQKSVCRCLRPLSHQADHCSMSLRRYTQLRSIPVGGRGFCRHYPKGKILVDKQKKM